MAVKWTFEDLSTSSVIELDINPDAGGSPQYKKTITTQNTVAPGGKTLIFEGADVAPQITFSGTILDESLYDKYVTLFNIGHQLLLTDDLGRTMMIYITEFSPQRVYSPTRFWRHTFTAAAQIMDWAPLS